MNKILAYERVEHCRRNVRIFNLEKRILRWQHLLVPFKYEDDYCMEENIDAFHVALASKNQDVFFFYWSLLSVTYVSVLRKYKTYRHNTVNEENMSYLWISLFDMFQGMNFAINREVSFICVCMCVYIYIYICMYICKLSQDDLL